MSPDAQREAGFVLCWHHLVQARNLIVPTSPSPTFDLFIPPCLQRTLPTIRMPDGAMRWID
jgi:hypothetical protein